jgi:leader peptidase (prepilin peptidase) / N-methyltransferase
MPPLNTLLLLAGSLLAGWAMHHLLRWQLGARRVPLAVLFAASAAVAIWAALVMPSNFLLATTLLLGWILLALSMVDFLALRLPDVLTLPLAAAGLLISLLLPEGRPLTHLIGAAAGFFALYAIARVYSSVRRREGLGLGDAKLAAAAGAWLGWQLLPFVVLIACAAGFVWLGIAVMFRGRAALREEIAFGVPLCLAIWLVWLYGVPDFVLGR